MKRSAWLRILLVIVASVALAGTQELAFAQRGGRGGGGGFHGGGGGFHGGGGFRGGVGAFRGGVDGFHGGFRGGFPGWRGGFFGPRFGYGWGLNIGFGWGPDWPAYPYFYGYSPWWGAPYYYYYPYYPYYVPYGVPDPDNRRNDASPDTSRPNNDDDPPEQHSNTPLPESSPNPNSVTSNVAAYRPPVPSYRITVANGATSNYRLAHSTTQQLQPGLRPAVQNAIRALRAMPPDARRRQLNSSRYDSFSPEERELLNNAAQAPLV
jgi:hypothetical protein